MVRSDILSASSAFESQQAFITELEQQMENLSISTLFHQTYAAEDDQVLLNRTDSDSMLAVVARESLRSQSIRTPWTSPACISAVMRRYAC